MRLPELISTLSRLVREKKLAKTDYRKLKGCAMADLADVGICQVTPEVMVSAVSLLESHPLRAMDALHVACALAVEPDMFVSADYRQLSAARKAGLKIVDVS
jgi:predicted nucleic acid-binding protein